MNYSHFTSLVGYAGAPRLLQNFLFLCLEACSKWHNLLSRISPSTGLSPPSAVKNEAACLSLHSDWPSIPQGTPQQGSLQKPTADLLPPFDPRSIAWPAPSLFTADEHGMGFKQASPSVQEAAGTTADNVRHCLSSSMCHSCFGGWGERWPAGSVMLISNSFYAHNKSISTGYCWTHTESDAVSTASAFWAAAAIWELSAFWG